jgi:ABC-type transporter Mla subunit MlaD
MNPATSDDVRRIEARLESLTDAVTQLVRVEERQLNHAELIRQCVLKLETLSAAQTATDRKLDSWINRGIGVWGIAALIWTIYLGTKP